MEDARSPQRSPRISSQPTSANSVANSVAALLRTDTLLRTAEDDAQFPCGCYHRPRPSGATANDRTYPPRAGVIIHRIPPWHIQGACSPEAMALVLERQPDEEVIASESSLCPSQKSACEKCANLNMLACVCSARRNDSDSTMLLSPQALALLSKSDAFNAIGDMMQQRAAMMQRQRQEFETFKSPSWQDPSAPLRHGRPQARARMGEMSFELASHRVDRELILLLRNTADGQVVQIAYKPRYTKMRTITIPITKVDGLRAALNFVLPPPPPPPPPPSCN